MAIDWKTPRTSRTSDNYYVAVATYKGGRAGRRSFCIKLSPQFLDDMRWRIGDRVAIGVDGSTLYIKRSDSGYAIAASGGGPKRQGKSGIVSMTEDNDTHTIEKQSFQKDDVMVDAGVVSFLVEREPF